MSVFNMDTFVPFDRGPGAEANIERWRKMAQLFAKTGVVRTRFFNWPPTSGEQNPLMVFHFDGTNLFLSPGPCWVNGFYGRNHTQRLIPASDPGLVVVRLDPTAQEMSIVYRPNTVAGDEIKDPNGWWEMPLAHFWGAATPGLTDLRTFTPLEVLPPPVTEIPGWVPRGYKHAEVGPPAELMVGPGTAIHAWVVVSYPGAHAWYVPNRNYRITATSWFRTGGGFTDLTLNVRAWDDTGSRGEAVMHAQQVPPFGSAGVRGTAQFDAYRCQSGLVVGVEAIVNGTAFWFDAWNTRIEIEDVGQ